MRLAGLIVLIALVQPPPASAAPKIKQPTANWTVETQANECMLVRTYGTPRNPLFLTFSKEPMGGEVTAYVLYNREWALYASGDGGTVQFDGAEPIRTSFGARLLWNLSKEVKTLTMRQVWFSLEENSQRLLPLRATTVAVSAPGEIKYVFALPGQAEALDKLDDCAVGLGAKWGYPADEQRRMMSPPKPEIRLGKLFSGADYPLEAVRDGRMGRVFVRLRISETGALTDCSVVRSSGSAELDAATCTVIRERAKFAPARDLDGKAVRGVVASTVQWMLR